VEHSSSAEKADLGVLDADMVDFADVDCSGAPEALTLAEEDGEQSGWIGA